MNVSGNGKVDITNIPLGPSGTTARRIYRTDIVSPAPEGAFHQVVEIGDNITTSYEDNKSDADLGATMYINAINFDSVIPPFMV